MKKVYRTSQMNEVIGRPIAGMDFHKYGIPYISAGGTFHSDYPDEVDLVLAAAELHPELHIVTTLLDGTARNRFVEENASYYELYHGDADPEIEFHGWSIDDFPAEAWEQSTLIDLSKPEEFEKLIQEPAVRWILNKSGNSNKVAK